MAENVCNQSREDKAKVKRVELHAHTQMSKMDSVVSVRDLIRTAARWGWDAVAITDHGVVQAFPEAMKTVIDDNLDIKVIYGMEGYLTGDDYKQRHTNHIILLAKNQVGLHNLYRLVTLSHLQYFFRQPRIPRNILQDHREGLILGSACEAGELIRAIVAQESEEKLLEIASFYDYLEIQPIENNAYLVRSELFPNVNTAEDLRNINRKVAEIAKKLNKLLVATCDPHFLNPKDAICRTVVMASAGFEDAELQPPLYLWTTDEMLKEFDYLGEEIAYEAVVTNPCRIAEMVERVQPLPDGVYKPTLPNAENELKELSYQRAHQWYGKMLPDIVQERLEKELSTIVAHGFSTLYLIAHKLAQKTNADGYYFSSSNSIGSYLVATMTDISEINPLPPHWRCPKCQYSEFITDGSYSSGFDLPDKNCPNCGETLIKDGHNIPLAVFLEGDGTLAPDITLCFPAPYRHVARKYLEQIWGHDKVIEAGNLSTISENRAYTYVQNYFEKKEENHSERTIRRIAKGCVGMKRASRVHPTGVMIVPQDMDVHFFTPLQYPDGQYPEDKDRNVVMTHYDYRSFHSLIMLDFLGNDDLTLIKMLHDLSNRDPSTIPFDDPQMLSLFHSTEALGVSPEELGTQSGAFGISEYQKCYARPIIGETSPACFSDLIRIFGLSHDSHATAWVMMAFRIAYYKVHYPLVFYAAYFTLHADAFDVNIIAAGKKVVRERLKEMEAEVKWDEEQKNQIDVLQIAWEMYLRGFSMEPIDLYRSDAKKYILLEKSLLPPFIALKGFGTHAAYAIVSVRKKGQFSSIADIKKRTSALSKKDVELLRNHGCFEGMDES